jgi:hypothetical protein
LGLVEDRWLAEQIDKAVFRLSGEPPEPLPAGFIYAKVPADDRQLFGRLQSMGFQLVDTAMTFESSIPFAGTHPSGTQFRMATPEDAASVLDIARTSFAYDRFHADPQIPKTVADRVKKAWVANYFSGKRGDWLVVADVAGKPEGFLLLLNSEGKLVIDLIAVSAERRGQHLARGMIAFAAQSLPQFTTMRVGTQVANIPSIRHNEAMGFCLVGVQHILHCHR